MRLWSYFGTIFSGFLPKVGALIVAVILIFIFSGPLFVHYSPYRPSGPPYSAPSFSHLFGTDFQGKDIASEIIWGAYPSLVVSLLAALGATTLGFVIGVLSGYFVRMGQILGGGTDIFLTLPALPSLLLIGSFFIATNTIITALLILFFWSPAARAVRSQVAAIKKLPYVDAAKTSGLNDLKVILKVIFPEVGAIAIAYFVLNLALMLVIATALEFLGLGDPLAVSWGSILYWAEQFAFLQGAWWWIAAPGLFITLITVGFALIGFSLEEIMNPRLRS